MLRFWLLVNGPRGQLRNSKGKPTISWDKALTTCADNRSKFAKSIQCAPRMAQLLSTTSRSTLRTLDCRDKFRRFLFHSILQPVPGSIRQNQCNMNIGPSSATAFGVGELIDRKMH